MSVERSPSELATLFAGLEPQLAVHSRAADACDALTTMAVRVVAGAQHAGISRARAGRFETIAPTGELPRQVDRLQYELGDGPSVDAAMEHSVVRSGDLGHDQQWPCFGKRVATETGVLSMLAVRLLLGDDDRIAALNMYSTEPDAFDGHAQAVGVLLATHGGIAVTVASSRERANGLEAAVMSNRDIGIAMGILMNRHLLTRQQAFDMLRVASQHGHRKLVDIAREVADTGVFEPPPNQDHPSQRAADRRKVD